MPRNLGLRALVRKYNPVGFFLYHISVVRLIQAKGLLDTPILWALLVMNCTSGCILKQFLTFLVNFQPISATVPIINICHFQHFWQQTEQLQSNAEQNCKLWNWRQSQPNAAHSHRFERAIPFNTDRPSGACVKCKMLKNETHTP